MPAEGGVERLQGIDGAPNPPEVWFFGGAEILKAYSGALNGAAPGVE